ncbi:MAG: hypothetical protein AB7O43_18355 [Hyphomicrobiaceae bacterium]
MKSRVIETTRGKRKVKVHGGRSFDPDSFYKVHRGGSGNVIVVYATEDMMGEKIGIFGSIETAQEWAYELGEKWHCIFVPYVVDHPDFGNATKQ